MDALIESLLRGDYMPHGHCYWWKPDILWLNVASDFFIALAYFTIPFALYYFVKKRTDMEFKGIFTLFSLFIAMCGVTHLFSIVVIWHGYYGVHGLLKLVTALVSCLTAYQVFRSIPTALAIPGHKELEQAYEDTSREKLERIRLEHARKQEEILRESTDSAHVGILVINKTGVIRVANRAVGNIFDYGERELEGQHINVLVDHGFSHQHTDLMESFFASDTMSKSMANDRIIHGMSKSGKAIPIEVRLNKQKLDGEPMVFVSLQDISRRIAAENARNQSEAITQNIIRALPLGMHIFELDGDMLRFVSDNPRARSLLAPLQQSGASAVALAENKHFPFPDDKNEYQRYLNIAKTGKPLLNHTVVKPTANSSHTFTVHAFQSSPGKVIVLFDDVTDRKRTESLLREQDEMVRRAINASIAGVFIYNRFQRTNRYINERFTQITGYTPSQLNDIQSGGLLSLVHPDDRKIVRAHIRQILQPGHSEHTTEIECRMKHESGHWIWVLSHNGPFEKDAQGRVTQVIGSFLDISQLKAMQENLVQVKDRAEQASEARGAFLANMSHEIRTPLNAIIALTRLMTDMHLEEKPAEYMRRIYQSSKSLLGILNAILDYSRLEANKIEVNQAPFNLQVMLKEILNLFSVSASEKQLTFHADVAPDLPRHWIGDATKIAQILNNLVGNAIKFTPYGEITLCAEVETVDSAVPILRFSVIDTGIGFENDIQDRLFNAFTQADSSIDRKFGGSGLGLAICQRLAQLLGGTMSAQSTPGKGSTFSLTIPLTIDYAVSGQYRKPDEQHSVSIAGDNSFSVYLVNRYFKSSRIPVTTLPDISALQYTTLASTDILFIDLTGQRREGNDIVSAIFTSKHLPGRIIKGVVLIATESEYQRIQMKTPPAVPVAWLIPPFLPQDIEHAIHALLSPEKRIAPIISETIEFNNCHVLLVEDNEANQYVAKELLEKLGCQVSIAESGERAVDMVTAAPFDIVLMDLQMPGMDGFSATQQIRKIKSATDLPVYALSAAISEHEINRLFESGMQGYITKPIDNTALSSLLKDALPGKWVSKADEHIAPPILRIAELQENLPALNVKQAAARLQNSVAIYLNLLKNFVQTYRPTAGETVVFPPENTPFSRALHTLKGLAKSIGATRLTELASGLPTDSSRQDELYHELQYVVSDIAAYLARHQAALLGPPVKTTLNTLISNLQARLYLSQEQIDEAMPLLVEHFGKEGAEQIQRALQELRYEDALALIHPPT